MLPRLGLARMIRLCLKELRESLRDRRTIVTLVLMPLLVYPLLSLVLNRVLLTSVASAPQPTVNIGIGKELEDSAISSILLLGYSLSQFPESSTVMVEEVVQDGKPRKAAGVTRRNTGLLRPQLVTLDEDGREALRTSSVDIVIVRKSNAEQRANVSDAGRNVLNEMLGRYSQMPGWPEDFDIQGVIDLIGQLEVRYRQGDQQSERAMQLVERSLNAINIEVSRALSGGQYQAPFRLSATPVAMKSNYADLLATMVPLVLVLMTMAGAVYPAIDLTAGERERGTMEALIVSPTPAYALLLAKYSAVVTVALLTALANLAAMSVTLWVSGIGAIIFGDGLISPGVIGTVLVLLVLFTMFFAALLLAVTSFAKSFKEAQAYLIPLMLLALTPGVMSLLPGIEFSGLLATVPLVNIVLLAREVLVGGAQWSPAMVAVICNGVYALAALSIASRLFGSDASMSGSQGSWRDLLVRPKEKRSLPTLDQMAMTMAAMFPLYFISSSSLQTVSDWLAGMWSSAPVSVSNDEPALPSPIQLQFRLWISALLSFVLILGLPVLVAINRRISLIDTFRLRRIAPGQWVVWVPAVLLIGSTAWMAAHEIFILGQALDIGTIGADQLEAVAAFRDQLSKLPLPLVLFVFAVTPAICEEFLFRGFVLSALINTSKRKQRNQPDLNDGPQTRSGWSTRWYPLLISSLLFGLMHVLTSNVLAVERFLPTTFMGIILGIVAIRTGSLWPGIILHAFHNGLLLSMGHFEEWLKSNSILVEEGTHLPFNWLIGGSICFVLGAAILILSTRRAKPAEAVKQSPSDSPPSEPPTSEPPAGEPQAA